MMDLDLQLKKLDSTQVLDVNDLSKKEADEIILKYSKNYNTKGPIIYEDSNGNEKHAIYLSSRRNKNA